MKHGILIMAHNNVEVVKASMRMLDDSRFRFFLHIDAKSELSPDDFIPELKNTDCVVLERRELNWAGYSFIDVMLRLIEAALKENMDYLHFLQGADLPLKTPDYINDFCEKHNGCNFLRFQPHLEELARYKVLCKHFLVDNKNYRTNKFRRIINHGIARLQKPFMNKNKKYYHGSSLFSITAEFGQYLLDKESSIYKEFRYSLAGDEVFAHTIFMESPFVETLYGNNAVRLIDWERHEGNSPYTFTMKDLDEIKSAINAEDCLFARKFNEKRDIAIVREIEKTVMTNGA